jgi:hypothetical protein
MKTILDRSKDRAPSSLLENLESDFHQTTRQELSRRRPLRAPSVFLVS